MLLRDYFFQRYRELHSGGGVYPGVVGATDPFSTAPDPMAEYFVDSNVARFMEDLETHLGAMKTSLAQLRETRQQAIDSQTTNQPLTRKRVKELAGRISDKAGDIFKMVAMVVMDLRAEKKPAGAGQESMEFFGDEMRLLQAEVGKAEQRINAMFLAPTHTVTIGELQGDNVLTELKSIQSVSKEIEKNALTNEVAE